jgi:hypothetical protein
VELAEVQFWAVGQGELLELASTARLHHLATAAAAAEPLTVHRKEPQEPVVQDLQAL